MNKYHRLLNLICNFSVFTLLFVSPHVYANASVAPTGVIGTNSLWISLSTILVLMMTMPGLLMFYSGLVRRKNVLFTCLQILSVVAVVAIVWFLAGYSLAFTKGSSLIGGVSRLFGSNLFNQSVFPLSPSIYEGEHFLFQMAFAIISASLIVGATAERMRLSTTVAFSGLWVLLVYAPVAHWIWHPEGWLSLLGHKDWAGGAVVHITAGVSGLVAARMLGARSAFQKEPMPPHNLLLTSLGACFLWLGWFGFNSGNILENGGSGNSQMLTLFVTFFSGCVGALVWAFCEYIMHRKVSTLGFVTGALVGLVSVTPAAGYVGINGALVIPALASLVSLLTLTYIKKKTRIDDSLDVFAIHGAAGLIGTLLTPIFAYTHLNIVLDHLIANSVGALAVALYSGLLTALILLLVKPITGWRVDATAEQIGLDLALLGETIETESK